MLAMVLLVGFRFALVLFVFALVVFVLGAFVWFGFGLHCVWLLYCFGSSDSGSNFAAYFVVIYVLACFVDVR